MPGIQKLCPYLDASKDAAAAAVEAWCAAEAFTAANCAAAVSEWRRSHISPPIISVLAGGRRKLGAHTLKEMPAVTSECLNPSAMGGTWWRATKRARHESGRLKFPRNSIGADGRGDDLCTRGNKAFRRENWNVNNAEWVGEGQSKVR